MISIRSKRYKFYAIQTKILSEFFMKFDRLVLKLIWKRIRLRRPKIT